MESLLFSLPLWLIAFVLSLTCHEAAHAWAGLRGGDETAYLGGQVSLNPMPHLQREPIGAVLVPILTFFLYNGQWMIGWASAPYDPLWARRYPLRAAGMAIAGPLANALLAGLALVAIKIGLAAGWWVRGGGELDRLIVATAESGGAAGAAGFLSILFGLNMILFLFNLIPLPPLDGAAIVAGLFPPARAFYEGMASMAMGGFIGILLAWWIFGFVLDLLPFAALI